MASIFMRIDGLTSIKGGATVDKIGGKEGFFAIENVSWNADRDVTIDLGNANNADKGMGGLGKVVVKRTSDGASPYLTTLLFSPGDDGKTIEIVMTKPSRAGDGMEPYMVITLEKARMAHYNIDCHDGQLPQEDLDLVYTTFSTVYYTEGVDGKIEKGDTVKFDTTTNTVVSKASL